MDTLENQANRLYDQQKYPEALDIYLSLLKKYPKAEKYSMYCGNCFDAIGQTGEAARYYKKASKLNPVSPNALLALSNLYYQREDYANAEKFAHMVLQKFKNDTSALLILGNCAYCKADFETALSFYEKVCAINPSSYIGLINMANTSFDLGKYVKAIDFAFKALEIYPASVDAYIIAGNSYMELSKTEKAEKNLLKALNFKSDNPWIYNSLSRLYQKAEDWENALNFGWKAVLFAGDAADDQHINFGYLLYECIDEKKSDLALEYARKWLEAFEKNKLVAYMANSILEDKKIKTAEPEYLVRIFDTFATDFDETLHGLEYLVPQHIAEMVQKHHKKEFFKRINCLDLGCGTGLCAQMIKDMIGWSAITGVDLSPKMLEKARQKGVYNHLEQAEIVNFLNTTDKTYQLVVAGDVLTYFGDLKPLFEGVAKVLSLGGLFVFSICENNLNKDDYCITPAARFVHSTNYILKQLKKRGYNKLDMIYKPLRNEGDKVVYGYIFAAQKVMIVEK